MCKYSLPVFWLTMIACWAQQGSTDSGSKKALVIGNGAYRHLPHLAALKNAKAIASALRERNVDVTEKYDLDQKALVQEIELFAGRVRAGDIVLLYFYGYGFQVKTENLLLPIDFDLRKPTANQSY